MVDSGGSCSTVSGFTTLKRSCRKCCRCGSGSAVSSCRNSARSSARARFSGAGEEKAEVFGRNCVSGTSFLCGCSSGSLWTRETQRLRAGRRTMWRPRPTPSSSLLSLASTSTHQSLYQPLYPEGLHTAPAPTVNPQHGHVSELRDS